VGYILLDSNLGEGFTKTWKNLYARKRNARKGIRGS